MAINKGIIETLTSDGDGALTDERGCLVSIPGTLPGETVEYRVDHVSPHEKRAWAMCCAVKAPSPDRVMPRCESCYPVRGQCGGCPIMHMGAQLQSAFKKKTVLDALQAAGINYIRDLEYVEAPSPFGYRNRTDLVAGMMRGRPVLGSYEPRSHKLIVTKYCPILRQPLNQAIAACVATMTKEHIAIYEPGRSSLGALRYVSFFANDAGEVMVDLVVTSGADHKEPQWLRRFATSLREAFARISGITFSINDSPNNALRVAASELIWGEPTLIEHYNALETRLSASGFTQLNSDVAAKIYASARDWLERPARVVWDLYCGVGSFGRTMAPTHRLFGAEFSPTAIKTAQSLAPKDAWQSVYEVINLEKEWPGHWTRPDVILVDPPRKGLSQLVIDKLAEIKGADVFYMSCNAESFAKNVAKLDPSYEILRLAAYDMMPQTRHVELLAHLKHR